MIGAGGLVLLEALSDLFGAAVSDDGIDECVAAGLGDVDWDPAAINVLIKRCIGAHGLKMPKLAMPLRVLLTGQTQTPSVDALVALFPRELALKRLSS